MSDDRFDIQFLPPTGATASGSVGTALVLPGLHYTADAPLLWWSGHVLRSSGWRVASLAWDSSIFSDADPVVVVEAAAQALWDAVEADSAAGPRLIITKSISAGAAAWAERHELPAIFFTPVLHGESSAQVALAEDLTEELADYREPSLVVGSLDDRTWDTNRAEAASGDVLEFQHGDHGLVVADNWTASLDALTQVCGAVDVFARNVLKI